MAEYKREPAGEEREHTDSEGKACPGTELRRKLTLPRRIYVPEI